MFGLFPILLADFLFQCIIANYGSACCYSSAAATVAFISRPSGRSALFFYGRLAQGQRDKGRAGGRAGEG
jgi:hypothetical protein